MSRERREWAPGDLQNIVGRAHEGRPIFATDEDRGFFSDRLRRVFGPGFSAVTTSSRSSSPADLLAWALMSNHHHLGIRVRDGVPGCRGASDGCGLVHVARPRRGPRSAPSAAPDAAQAGWSSCAFASRVHDERFDRAVRLRASGWERSRLLESVCARLGVDPRAVAAGRRRHAENRARAVILPAACDGAGVTLREAARLVGIRGSAAAASRRRGSDVLAAHGWTRDDVLAWAGPRCG